jgi:hypothetical protein
VITNALRLRHGYNFAGYFRSTNSALHVSASAAPTQYKMNQHRGKQTLWQDDFLRSESAALAE